MSIIVNPDTEYARDLKRAVKKNNGYCPHATVRNKDTKCPCKEFRDMDEGMCSCGLYIKVKD